MSLHIGSVGKSSDPSELRLSVLSVWLRLSDTHVHTHTHTLTVTVTRTFTYKCKHTHTHTHIHIHTYTHTYTHIHTHTHAHQHAYTRCRCVRAPTHQSSSSTSYGSDLYLNTHAHKYIDKKAVDEISRRRKVHRLNEAIVLWIVVPYNPKWK